MLRRGYVNVSRMMVMRRGQQGMMSLRFSSDAKTKEVEENPIVSGSDYFEAQGYTKEEFGQSVLKGAFGTRENPVKVPSWHDSRIVGCTGGPGEEEHELLWHEVKKGKPLICLECGQWFELVDHPLKYKQAEYEESLADEDKERLHHAH